MQRQDVADAEHEERYVEQKRQRGITMEGRGIEFTVQRGRVTQIAPGDLVESRERWVIVAGAEGAGAQRRADGDGEAAQRVAIRGVTGVGILPGEGALGIGIAE